MGKSSNAVAVRLGNKNVFWKSELYGYYYNNALSVYLKINYILNKVLKAYGIFSISNKFYFINNIFLLLVNFKKFYWKYACSILKRFGKKKKKCPYLLSFTYKICNNVRCLWYNRVALDNKNNFVFLDRINVNNNDTKLFYKNFSGYIPKWQMKIIKTDVFKKHYNQSKIIKYFNKLKSKRDKSFFFFKNKYFFTWITEKKYNWCRYFSNKRYYLRGVSIFRSREQRLGSQKSVNNLYLSKKNKNNLIKNYRKKSTYNKYNKPKKNKFKGSHKVIKKL